MKRAGREDRRERKGLGILHKVPLLMDILAYWRERCSLGWTCVFWPGICFCDNDRPGWLSRHSSSLSSTQPPVRSYQHCLRPSVWPPQAGRSVTRGWQKRKRESEWGGDSESVMGWNRKYQEQRALLCDRSLNGAACEFAVTGLSPFTNAWDDCPLMSFTVLQLSRCDWLVTALSLSVFITSAFGCIRKPILAWTSSRRLPQFAISGARSLFP